MLIRHFMTPSFIFACCCVLGFFWRETISDIAAKISVKMGGLGEGLSSIKDRVAAKRAEMQAKMAKKKGKVYQASDDEMVRKGEDDKKKGECISRRSMMRW
jgi:hypothetical protein